MQQRMRYLRHRRLSLRHSEGIPSCGICAQYFNASTHRDLFVQSLDAFVLSGHRSHVLEVLSTGLVQVLSPLAVSQPLPPLVNCDHEFRRATEAINVDENNTQEARLSMRDTVYVI